MARYYNAASINIEEATRSILVAGGGISERSNSDGSTHITLYSRTSDRHLSYDLYPDGSVCNVHSSDGRGAYVDYKGGW